MIRSVASSPSIRRFQLMWLIDLRDQGIPSDADVTPANADFDFARLSGEPTYKEETERAERLADDSKEKADRRTWKRIIMGIVRAGLLSLAHLAHV